MEMKQLPCREHGGTFPVPFGRGRPPVRCGASMTGGKDYPTCTKHPENAKKSTKATRMSQRVIDAGVAAALDHAANARKTERTREQRASKPAQPVVQAPTADNPSLPKAQEAKAQLVPLGWTVVGRAWADDTGAQCASVTANRETETLSLVWKGGRLFDQQYILWDNERPKANGMPARKLKFNPDEMSDTELVRAISGMPVEWWNSLGKSVEKGVVGEKVNIEHVYNGIGGETPGARVVKFVDASGHGFRNFHVSALIKVGR